MPRRTPHAPPRTQRSPQERDARSQAVQRVADQALLRGSLVRMERTCGKKNCRCQQGQKHPALYNVLLVLGDHAGKAAALDPRLVACRSWALGYRERLLQHALHPLGLGPLLQTRRNRDHQLHAHRPGPRTRPHASQLPLAVAMPTRPRPATRRWAVRPLPALPADARPRPGQSPPFCRRPPENGSSKMLLEGRPTYGTP